MNSDRSGTVELPAIGGVVRARREIRPWIDESPLVRCELLSRMLEADVWIKNETVGPIASFKLRGALTHLLRARDLKGAVPRPPAITARASPTARACSACRRISSFPR